MFPVRGAARGGAGIIRLPFPPLVEFAARQQLRLGWDHKTERDPSWQCLACSREFHRFPCGEELVALSGYP